MSLPLRRMRGGDASDATDASAWRPRRARRSPAPPLLQSVLGAVSRQTSRVSGFTRIDAARLENLRSARLRRLSTRRAGPTSARPSVSSSAYSRSAPTGSPLASRVTDTSGAIRRRPSAMCSAVASPVVVGLVAITTSRTSPIAGAVVELGDLQILGIDPVDRRQRATEDVVAALELVRALDRDHVRGLLDDADQRPVAALIRADPAARTVREVEAHLAQPDPLLDLGDRVGERERLLVAGAQDVKGEPLRRAAADPGQLRQLGDQPLDRRGVHEGFRDRADPARRGRRRSRRAWPRRAPGRSAGPR